MDIIEAVKKRKTCRGFKPDPVPPEVLREIMTLALRAPSWANTQPWEFAVVTGKKLEEIKQGHVARVDEEGHPNLAFPRSFPEAYLARFPGPPPGARGAGRDDPARRKEMRVMSARLYNAPCIIYIHTDRSFYQQADRTNVYPVFDAGLAAQTIMLLAVNYGLSTVPAATTVWYPDLLRKSLRLPDSRLIVLGIGVGYPDPTHPSYAVYSPREPLEKMVRFYG
jgi:nitroreductase